MAPLPGRGHAQPKDIQELLHKLLKDLQIISEELAEYINLPSWNRPAYYYEDDDEDSIPETESDEVIKSSVENLVPIPSASEDSSDIESECDVPVCDDFTTSSNPLFDFDDDFSSSDDESFSNEDIPKEIYSNPLFDEEIISTKIDSLLEEFSGELTHINLIPPGINEADFDPKEGIPLISLFEDSDSLNEEIDYFYTPYDYFEATERGIEKMTMTTEGKLLFP
ncbi:hypothetical protein Tco_0751873 [Tanacetum coccineum]|uniref:Uncharacterized protein n=1 Tax=Tanacetum coccineum TaxID=301880 RepID=A0ABQ4Z8J0_9ASTR